MQLVKAKTTVQILSGYVEQDDEGIILNSKRFHHKIQKTRERTRAAAVQGIPKSFQEGKLFIFEVSYVNFTLSCALNCTILPATIVN